MARPKPTPGDQKGMDALARDLADVAQRLSFKQGVTLAKIQAEILRDGNKDDRIRGVDKGGHKLTPVKPSTQRDRTRKGRGKGARLRPGPGRDPRESRSITNFFTRILSMTPASLRITWGWTGMPWLKYHLAGSGRLPRADISGPSPRTRNRLGGAFRDFVEFAWRSRKRK